MNIALDAKRAFHNTRGLGNYSRDLIRILQEHEIGHLYHRNYASILLLEKAEKPMAQPENYSNSS